MDAIVKLDRWLHQYRFATLVTTSFLSWALSILSFFALRYVDAAQRTPWHRATFGILLSCSVYFIIGYVYRIFQGGYIIGSRDEALVIAKAVIYTGTITLIISLLWPGSRLLPLSTVLGGTIGALMGNIGVSMVVRLARESSRKPVSGELALIFGAGTNAQQLIDSMLSNPDSPYLPVGVLDDNPKLSYLKIRNIPYLGNRTSIQDAVRDTGATTLIIAVVDGSGDLYRSLNATATAANMKVKILRPLSTLFDASVGIEDLSDIDITDLLGRVQLDTDVESIAGYITGKRVLVTGAGGSIGSELCRQIQRFAPDELIMLDRDESALHGLQLSITGRALLDSDDVVLADIRDSQALDALFEDRKPEVVFHAAALKHLPMLEQYPSEAWKTNVFGTLNVLHAAQQSGVDVFVNISTDKAANPESVLGYTKRIAERLTSAYDSHHQGRYVSVRFGNVLGSRGSVLETFVKQIAQGGPLTVTHPEVTRYFMTIPEAVQLVIQAAAFGQSGEALVLEMGTPVKIVEVAQQLIDMSHKHIEIVFTGLRKGEKLHEHLTGSHELLQETRHNLIKRVEVPPIPISGISAVDIDAVENVKEFTARVSASRHTLSVD